MFTGMDPAVFSSMSSHGQGDTTGTQDASQGRILEFIKHSLLEDKQLLISFN